MPVITVELGKTDAEIKTNLIRNLTATAVETSGIPAEKFTILIHELEDLNIGVGGKTLKEIKAAR